MIILLVNRTDYFIIKKEVVSPKSSTMMGKTIGQPADSGDELKPEIVQGTKEAPNSNKKALDGSIVGSRIKVRWPADEMFYNGLVKSFDASSETHEIVYDHGDVVRQSLKDEKWEFIAEEQDYNPDASPDMYVKYLLCTFRMSYAWMQFWSGRSRISNSELSQSFSQKSEN
jgi:hypothetical protein